MLNDWGAAIYIAIPAIEKRSTCHRIHYWNRVCVGHSHRGRCTARHNHKRMPLRTTLFIVIMFRRNRNSRCSEPCNDYFGWHFATELRKVTIPQDSIRHFVYSIPSEHKRYHIGFGIVQQTRDTVYLRAFVWMIIVKNHCPVSLTEASFNASPTATICTLSAVFF